MKYCENCHLISTKDVCEECGRELTREPQAGDFCLLVEKEEMWAKVLCEILKDADIECVCVPVMGAGMSMSIGAAFEREKVYVPFEKTEEAKELMMQWENGAQETETEENPISEEI